MSINFNQNSSDSPVPQVLLCLIVPAYQALQLSSTMGPGSDSSGALLRCPHHITRNNVTMSQCLHFSIPRYWLVLTMVFLSELFLDQLNLSPTFTLIKLAFMFWCVAPMEYNGSHVIYEKVTVKNVFKKNSFWLR